MTLKRLILALTLTAAALPQTALAAEEGKLCGVGRIQEFKTTVQSNREPKALNFAILLSGPAQTGMKYFKDKYILVEAADPNDVPKFSVAFSATHAAFLAGSQVMIYSRNGSECFMSAITYGLTVCAPGSEGACK